MRTQRYLLFTIFFILLIDLIGFSIIFPLFPSMLDYYCGNVVNEWLKNTLYQAHIISDQTNTDFNFLITVLFGGLLAALYSLLQFIFSPIWGSLSDRLGRRPVILISIAGSIMGYIIWIFSGSLLLLLLSRIITGAMSANMSVATAAIADITDDSQRSKGMALVGIAFGAGFILGPLFGGLSSTYNLLNIWPNLTIFGINPFSLPALIAFTLSVCNFIGTYLYFQETLPQTKRTHSPYISPWKRLLSFIAADNHKVRWISWVNFWFIFIFSGMEFSLNFLAKERFAFTPMDNGLLFTYLGIIMIATQGAIVRRFAHSIGEKNICLIGLFLGIIGFFGLAMAATPLIFCIAAGILSLVSGLMNTLMSLASLYSTVDHQGRDMGIFRSAASLGRFFGPLITASIYFYFGSSMAYIFCAIGLIGPLWMLFFI